MKGKILIISVIALAIAFFGLSTLNNSVKAWAEQPLCATVNYSAWGNCLNGIKTRDVIDKYPVNCALTSFQKESRSEICGKVLGEKTYKVGSLLRTPEGKIYVIMAGKKIKLIPNLQALKAYAGQPIFNVSDSLIAQYQKDSGVVLGVKIYANGTLLRGPNYKVYVIQSGKKHYISGPSELFKYLGQEILNVSAQTIADYDNI